MPAILPAGKFIRTTSIDELPQLINILKGDMAFIGPRPLLVKYLSLYSEEQRMIFERFYKQDEFVQGTGLGLSISMVIAEKLGGKISVASEIGKGSRFTFLLPYHNESEEFFSAG